MADLNSDFSDILYNPYGEVVRSAIASASASVAEEQKVDISYETTVITNARYGYEIREAIVNALYKLNSASPQPTTSDSCPCGKAIVKLHGAIGGVVGYTTINESQEG